MPFLDTYLCVDVTILTHVLVNGLVFVMFYLLRVKWINSEKLNIKKNGSNLLKVVL